MEKLFSVKQQKIKDKLENIPQVKECNMWIYKERSEIMPKEIINLQIWEYKKCMETSFAMSFPIQHFVMSSHI